MLFDTILFIVFLVVGVRVALSVRRESMIFEEFESPKSLFWFVLLLPFVPLVLLILPHHAGWIPTAILGTLCCLPALLTARRCVAIFETSGTSRSDAALKTSHTAFGASLAGLIYVSVFVVFVVLASGFGG
jgi:hypothetical protein